MKRQTIVNLIKHHSEGNEAAFEDDVRIVARDFINDGYNDLAEYVMALIQDTVAFTPQAYATGLDFLRPVKVAQRLLPLADPVAQDVQGIVNAIRKQSGVSRFLFIGAPGTGKTEVAKQLALTTDRALYSVNFSEIVDSKLGQTQKNVDGLFREIEALGTIMPAIVLFDEIDALVLDRVDANDHREMGRATSTFLRNLDELPRECVLIATTNLGAQLDPALARRFDYTVSFDRYSTGDLAGIFELLVENELKKYACFKSDKRILKKMAALCQPLPMPGDLDNVVRSSLAFAPTDSAFSYFETLYTALTKAPLPDPAALKSAGFTFREIESLTGKPKSTLSREIARNA